MSNDGAALAVQSVCVFVRLFVCVCAAHTVSHTYKVMVHTGDRPGGGTSAGVHMTLCGGPQSGYSSKLWLDNGQRAFLPGQSDVFVVTSPTLVSPLESLTIGHDSTGPSPGWFLEEVRITPFGNNHQTQKLKPHPFLSK